MTEGIAVRTRFEPITRRTWRIAGFSFWILSILLLAGCARTASRLDDLFDAPRFSLSDESGQPFGSADLAGKVWLANFIFTTCTDECPAYLSPKMRAVQEDVLANDLGQQVALVSFTVDPARDTPAVLKEYAARYGAQPGLWHFLTGADQVLSDLYQNGFKVGSAFVPASTEAPALTQSGTPGHDMSHGNMAEGGTLVHSTRFLLVDRQGKIRAAYNGEDVEVEEMFLGIRQLLKNP